MAASYPVSSVLPSPSADDSDPVLQETVRRAQQGDRAALDDLLARHLTQLRAFIRLRADETIRQKESCSDLVQSVCLEVLGQLAEFEYRGASSFRNWLFTHAENKIRNRARYWHSQKRDPGREVTPPASAAEGSQLLDCYATFCPPSRSLLIEEETRRIETAFTRLPDHYRDVITMAHVAGLSHAEIGSRMGKSVAATRVLLHRALARLATILERTAGADRRG